MKLNTSKIGLSGDLKASPLPIHILYGTTTGNSEILAEETAEKLMELGLANELSDTADFNFEKLHRIDTLLLIISTDSGGVPPWMAEDFYKFLNEKDEPDLNHLSYSVLALGDSYYPEFCQAGKDFDRMLAQLGAHRIAERVDCDIQYWDDFDYWFENVRTALEKKKLPPRIIDVTCEAN